MLIFISSHDVSANPAVLLTHKEFHQVPAAARYLHREFDIEDGHALLAQARKSGTATRLDTCFEGTKLEYLEQVVVSYVQEASH